MRLFKTISFLAAVTFLTSCSNMSRDQAISRIKGYDSDKAIEIYGERVNVTKNNELIKATGCFAEGGAEYAKVEHYKTEVIQSTSKTLTYFITESKIAMYKNTSDSYYKFLSVDYKKSGNNGLVIDVHVSDERDNSGLYVKMTQSIHDVVDDYGILIEETTNFYFSYSGFEEGEFEYKSSVFISKIDN